MNIFFESQQYLTRIHGLGEVIGNFISDGHIHYIFFLTFGNHHHGHIGVDLLN